MHFVLAGSYSSVTMALQVGQHTHTKLDIDLFLKTIKLCFICTGRHWNGTGRTLLNDTLRNEGLSTFAYHKMGNNLFNFAMCSQRDWLCRPLLKKGSNFERTFEMARIWMKHPKVNEHRNDAMKNMHKHNRTWKANESVV